jgi:hypothetical protein
MSMKPTEAAVKAVCWNYPGNRFWTVTRANTCPVEGCCLKSQQNKNPIAC